MDRNQYKDSSYLWSIANKDGEVMKRYQAPGEEWGALRGINHLLDLDELSSKDHVLGSSCNICNDGTVKLFVEEVQYLVNKLPFACQHKGFISSIQPSSMQRAR